MDERTTPGDELAGGTFDAEMTEPDEANAPDDTGPTAGPAEVAPELPSMDSSSPRQDEVGI